MKTLPVTFSILLLAGVMGLFSPSSATAETRLAVLDFELKDLTLKPRTPQELERTASLGPLLREALTKKQGYRHVTIGQADQAKANVSVGYLFDHPDVAAELGKRFGADWVAVGRLHKPSFLFAYLKVRLVNVRTALIMGDYIVEIKGYMKKLAVRGTEQLADQIDGTIRQSQANAGAAH